MAEEVKHKITRINNTRADLQANLKKNQIAVETDNDGNLVYKDNSSAYHITANLTEDATFADVVTTGTLLVNNAPADSTCAIRNQAAGWALKIRGTTNTEGGGFYEDATRDMDLRINDSAGSTKVLLDSDGDSYFTGGNVGIGMDSPIGRLHVQKSDDPSIYIENSGTDASQTCTISLRQGGFSATRIRAVSDDPFLSGKSRFDVLTDDTIRVSIGSGGNMGVGDTTPAKKLEVVDSSAAQLRLSHTADTHYTDFQVDGSGNLKVSVSGTYIDFDMASDNTEGLEKCGYIEVVAENSMAPPAAANAGFMKMWLCDGTHNIPAIWLTDSAGADIYAPVVDTNGVCDFNLASDGTEGLEKCGYVEIQAVSSPSPGNANANFVRLGWDSVTNTLTAKDSTGTTYFINNDGSWS